MEQAAPDKMKVAELRAALQVHKPKTPLGRLLLVAFILKLLLGARSGHKGHEASVGGEAAGGF